MCLAESHQDGANIRKESEIGHVIRFVDHGDLDTVETQVTAAMVIEKATRHATTMSTPRRRELIWAPTDSAVHGCRREADLGGEWRKRLVDLIRQLTCRGEDDCSG